MSEIKHTRKLSAKINFLSLSENDLYKIAMIIQNFATSHSRSITIRIESHNEEDEIVSENPNIFFQPEIPKYIGKITISLYIGHEDLKFWLHLSTSYMNLEVSGSQSKDVSALFYEVKRILENHRSNYHNFYKFMRTFWFQIIISVFLGYIVYVLFDLPLDYMSATISTFKGSTIHIILIVIGWICVCFGSTSGGFALSNMFEKAFPEVFFTGNLSCQSSVARQQLAFVFGVIVIPIIVNVISSIMYNG